MARRAATWRATCSRPALPDRARHHPLRGGGEDGRRAPARAAPRDRADRVGRRSRGLSPGLRCRPLAGHPVVARERLAAGIVIPVGVVIVRSLPAVTLMAVAVGAIALAAGHRDHAATDVPGDDPGRSARLGPGPARERPPAQRGDPRRRTATVSTNDRNPAGNADRPHFVMGSLGAMSRQRISSGSPYERTVGFSRAIRVGDRVLVSGTAPIWPDGSCDPDPGVQAGAASRSSWPPFAGGCPRRGRRPHAQLPRRPCRRGCRLGGSRLRLRRDQAGQHDGRCGRPA